MHRRSVFHYYWFGTCLRFLEEATAGRSIHMEGGILTNLRAFTADLDELGLVVTKRAAFQLDLDSLLEELELTEPGANLSAIQAERLADVMQRIRLTLDSELQGFETYVVTPKIIDVTKLIADVPSLFAPEVFEALPEIARYDFSEAGKCIAFERPTAAAFHVLRGTESVLRFFYCEAVRQKRVSPLMWGPVVKDLRTRAKTKRLTTLLNNLDNIRVSFRNPTQHPEKSYDIHEVQDLWSLCVEVVNRMLRTLRQWKQSQGAALKAD